MLQRSVAAGCMQIMQKQSMGGGSVAAKGRRAAGFSLLAGGGAGALRIPATSPSRLHSVDTLFLQPAGPLPKPAPTFSPSALIRTAVYRCVPQGSHHDAGAAPVPASGGAAAVG